MVEQSGGNHEAIYDESTPARWVDVTQRAIDLARLAEIREMQEAEPKYPIKFTEQEIIWQENENLNRWSVSTGRHTRSNTLAIQADMEHDGDLGGGTPQNPLRIGSIIHK